MLRRLVSAYETEPYPQAGGNPIGELVAEARNLLTSQPTEPTKAVRTVTVEKCINCDTAIRHEPPEQEPVAREPDAMAHATHWKLLLDTYDSLTICPYDAAKVESARQQGSEGPPWPVWIGTSPSAEPQRASGERDLLRRLVSAYETEPYPQAGGNPIGELVTEARNLLTSQPTEPTKTPDRNQRAQILDVLDHAHEYTSSETEWLAKSIRAILSDDEEVEG